MANLIYKDECLYVCKFVPYTNPHFWTDRNQTLHTSPPWSGRGHRVCMGPQYFTFPTFSAYFVGSGCPLLRSTWLPAPHYPAAALYPWCCVCWCDVTHRVLCNANAEKCSECVCVQMEAWWNWKWLMICTCVTNELHFQLHCISTNYNVRPINLRPSFFHSLSKNNTFLYLLYLPRRSSDMFR